LKKEQKNSPGKSKNKLGALYNPNYIDPRVLPSDKQPHFPAGTKTNYGLQIDQSRKHYGADMIGYQANTPYYNMDRDDNQALLAQGPGTGTFVPG